MATTASATPAPALAPYALGLQNAKEQREPVELTVQGTIPPWLAGVLYRTGPGTYSVPTDKDTSKTVEIQHWFDGFALHHRFEIVPAAEGEDAKSARVVYRNRKGAEDAEARVASEGKYVVSSFAQRDPCESIFNKFSSTYQRATQPATRNADSPSPISVNVTLTPDMPGFASHTSSKDLAGRGTLDGDAFAKYIVSKTDANQLQLLDSVTLEPLKFTTYKMYDERLNGELAAAHATRDGVTGDMYNFTLKLGPKPTYTVFRISNGKGASDGKGGVGEPEGTVKVLAQISSAPAAYLHSFGMTEKYLILAVWQADLKMGGLGIVTSGSIMGGMEKKWDPTRKTQMFVIDRHNGGVVAQYTAPPFFCFHQLNTYEENDDIVMDLAVYPTHDVLELLKVHTLRAASHTPHPSIPTARMSAHGRRFRLPAVSTHASPGKPGTATVEWTSASPIELATVHPHRYHKRYRYVYGVTTSPPVPGAPREVYDALIKLDVDTRAEALWKRPGYTAGEPIFVPRPGSGADGEEDDGVLLSVVLDAAEGRSALVVIDAATMEEVGRAEMGGPFPFGFHGAWRGAGAPLYAEKHDAPE